MVKTAQRANPDRRWAATVAGATQQRRIPPNPFPLPKTLLNDRLNFARPLESMAEGMADGAEYASARLVSRHGGRQPDWGIAVRLQWGQPADAPIVKALPASLEMMQLLRDEHGLIAKYARIANRD